MKTRRTAYWRKIKPIGPILIPIALTIDPPRAAVSNKPDKMEQGAPNKIEHGAHATDLIKEDCKGNLPEICRKVSQGF